MAALDETFLVGKVVEVNYLTSRVLLLSDLNSKIPITIEPGDYQSILSGTGQDNGILQFHKQHLLYGYIMIPLHYTMKPFVL